MTYRLAFQYAVGDVDQDVQWEVGPGHGTFPRIWNGSGFINVRARIAKAQMVGDWVCHRGIATGTSCGEVVSVGWDPGDKCGTPNYNGPCAQSWGRIESRGDLRCGPGDSGGPVYYASNAYGIVQGGTPAGGGNQCIDVSYMPLEGLGPGINMALYVCGC